VKGAVTIHLAQIYFQPAYFQPGIDYLEEPTFLHDSDFPLGKLRQFSAVNAFLASSRASYLEHIGLKIDAIARWSGNRGAHILVFPEYCVPVETLPALRALAIKYSMVIVAGTHRVSSSEKNREIYKDLRVPFDQIPVGCACAPIFLADGSVHVATKLKASKWESSLLTPQTKPTVLRVNVQDVNINIAIIPCIDCLFPEVIGNLWQPEMEPNLVLCPSLSPTVEHYNSIGAIFSSREVGFGLANSASFGGTFFNIPEAWAPYLKGNSFFDGPIPRGSEAVLAVSIQPNAFFVKKGTLQAVEARRPFPHPIVYESGNRAIEKLQELEKELFNWIEGSAVKDALDWIDLFLTDEASSIPELVVDLLRYLRHSLLPFYEGNPNSLQFMADLVRMPTLQDTMQYWSTKVKASLQLVLDLFAQAPVSSSDEISSCLITLKKQQASLPTEAIGPEAPALMAAPKPQTIDTAEFQDRGNKMQEIRNAIDSPGNRIVFITGRSGIGKTDLLKFLFIKSLRDWEPVWLSVPAEGSVSRLIADLAYEAGLSIDIDAGSASRNVFRQQVRKITSKLFIKPKKALIVDDLYNLLKYSTVREEQQLTVLLEEIGQAEFAGGRIFFVCSMWLPERWFKLKSVGRVHVDQLDATSIRRILDYQLRSRQMVIGDAGPVIPHEIVELIGGHALTARLVVDASMSTDLNSLARDMTNITGHIAQQLLPRITMSTEERLFVQRLCVFRLPVIAEVATQLNIGISPAVARFLTSSVIVDFDGQSIAMHEALRRYFYELIGDNELKRGFHKNAVTYYEKLRELHFIGKGSTVIAELVHHLVLSGQVSKAKQLRLLLIAEVKPAAKRLYKERQYDKALTVYQVLTEIIPDDAEVWAYMGRCYGRLNQWEESDRHFEKAVAVARRTGVKLWWIYRDWGHIRARYSHYAEASEHLAKAAELHAEDPSILAALAFMYWRSGDSETARQHFEDALELDANHGYTLRYFSEMLFELGELTAAKRLRDRYQASDEQDFYISRSEFDIDPEDM